MKRLLLFVIALALISTRALAQGGTIGGGGSSSSSGSVTVTDSLKAIANGSAAAPSVAFANSTTTGLYRFGADTIGFATGGAHSLRFSGGAAATIAGGAGNMTIQAGTGNSRTMTLQTTTSAGTAKNTFVLGADSSATFLGKIVAGDTIRSVGFRGTTFVSAGTNPATVGNIRVANNFGIFSRDAGNSTNFSIIYVDGSDRTVVGEGTTTTLIGPSASPLITVTNLGSDTLRTAVKPVFSGLTAAAGTPNTVCINATTKELTENAATSCVVSSRRFKENIAPLSYDSARAIVARLTPRTFTYKQGKRRALGLIAEEAVIVDPRLATYDGQGQINSVNYEQVTIALLAVVQQQQQDIDQLHKVLLGLLGAGGAAGAGLAGWRKRKVA